MSSRPAGSVVSDHPVGLCPSAIQEDLGLSLQGVGTGHCVFGALNEVLILGSREGALKGDAQGREIERVLRIQLAGSLPVGDRFVVLIKFAVHHC